VLCQTHHKLEAEFRVPLASQPCNKRLGRIAGPMPQSRHLRPTARGRVRPMGTQPSENGSDRPRAARQGIYFTDLKRSANLRLGCVGRSFYAAADDAPFCSISRRSTITHGHRVQLLSPSAMLVAPWAVIVGHRVVSSTGSYCRINVRRRVPQAISKVLPDSWLPSSDVNATLKTPDACHVPRTMAP
jgi:hypothetical protein